MTKREQVEEMAKHGCYDGCANGLRKFCDEYNGKPCKNMVRIANGLYEQGYRKISQGSVVLTKVEKQKLLKEMYEQGRFDAIADLDKEGKVVLPREEYERLKLELAIEKKRADESYTQKEVEEIIASKERIKSKETAEKIIIFLDDHCDCDSAYLVEQTKNYATKQFGVEIKE